MRYISIIRIITAVTLLSVLYVQIADNSSNLNNNFELSTLREAEAAGASPFVVRYGGDGTDQLHAVELLPEGGFVAVGMTTSGSFGGSGADAADGYMARFDDRGNRLWTHRFGGSLQDLLTDVIRTSDGNFVGVGRTKSFGNGGSDFLVVKLRPDGELLWQKAYGNKGFEAAYHVFEDTENSQYVVAGWAHGAFGVDSVIFRITYAGNLVEPALYYGRSNGNTFPDYAEDLHNIVKTPDGGYITSGWIHAAYDGKNENYDLWVMKLNSDFSVAWSRDYGGAENEGEGFDRYETISIDRTSDGGYILAGSTESFSSTQRILLVKLSSSGVVQWSRTVGGSVPATSNDVKAFDGYFLVTGRIGTFFVVLKISNTGTSDWFKSYGSGTGRNLEASDLGFAAVGNGDKPSSFAILNDSPEGSLGATYSRATMQSVTTTSQTVTIPMRTTSDAISEVTGGLFR